MFLIFYFKVIMLPFGKHVVPIAFSLSAGETAFIDVKTFGFDFGDTSLKVRELS